MNRFCHFQFIVAVSYERYSGTVGILILVSEPLGKYCVPDMCCLIYDNSMFILDDDHIKVG